MLASMYKGHAAYMHAVVWFSVVHLVTVLVLVCRTRAHQRMRGPYQDIDDANDSDDAHDSDEEREEQHQGNEQLHLQNPAAGENEEQRLLPRRNEEEQPEQPAAVDEQVPAEQPGAAVVRRGYCSFL